MYEADRPSSPATVAVPGLVYAVSDLNREVRELLEGSFPLVWVQGEISNLARPGSGHVYFSLKDDRAQVRCAMFRRRASRLNFRPVDGQEVLVKASLGLYEARGEYQLVVEGMEPAGEGALKLKFEALKAKLAAEGLFDTGRKRTLPRYPERIGVVTSPTGAAIRDVLTVLARRARGIEVVIYPCQVQGAGAAATIVAALERAFARAEVDVLIVGRGGGSLEDLWPFNEEAVARTIAASPLPVIAGVGHETDITIADLAADVRAPTPSAAAEICSQHAGDAAARVRHLEQRLMLGMDRRFAGLRLRIDHAARRLTDPRRTLAGLTTDTARLRRRLETAMHYRLGARRAALTAVERRLTARDPRRGVADARRHAVRLGARLETAVRYTLRARAGALDGCTRRLKSVDPRRRISEAHGRVDAAERRLNAAMDRILDRARSTLTGRDERLRALSPLATLNRGYAIVYLGERAVRSLTEVNEGDRLAVRVTDGQFGARVASDPKPEN